MAKKQQPVQQTSLLIKLFPTFGNFFSPKVGKSSSSSTKVGVKAKSIKPQLPIVNLLPPRLELDKMRRSTRRGFMFAALGILLTVGLLWGAQATVISVANSSLTSAQEQITAATANIEKYSEIKAYFKTIQERKDILAQKTGAKIDYSYLFETLLNSIPAGGSLNQVDVKSLLSADNAQADMNALISGCGPVTDPFAVETTAQPLSCMNFSGSVATRDAVAEIANTLKASGLFSNVSVVQASGSSSNGGIAFTGSAVVTSNAIVGVAGVPVEAAPAPVEPVSTPVATPSASASSTPKPTSTSKGN